MQNRFSEIFLSKGINYYAADKPLQEALNHLGIKGQRNLLELGLYVSSKMIESLDFIDHFAKPVLQTWSLMGERIDYVRVSPDHAKVLQELQEYEVIRSINGEPSDLMHHFLTGYLISDSGIFCTMTLTAQTAYIVHSRFSQKNDSSSKSSLTWCSSAVNRPSPRLAACRTRSSCWDTLIRH